MKELLTKTIYKTFLIWWLKNGSSNLVRNNAYNLDGAVQAIELNGLNEVLHNVVLKTTLNNLQEDQEKEVDLKVMSQFLAVVDTFAIPRYCYQPERSFYLRDEHQKSLFPDAGARSIGYRYRYEVLKQRLLRNDSFRKPAFGDKKSNSHLKV